MVEVFKTNVQTDEQAEHLLIILSETFPGLKMNFDLEDCDKILRAEGGFIETQEIMQLLLKYQYECQLVE